MARMPNFSCMMDAIDYAETKGHKVQCRINGAFWVAAPLHLITDPELKAAVAKRYEQRAVLSYIEDGCGEHG